MTDIIDSTTESPSDVQSPTDIAESFRRAFGVDSAPGFAPPTQPPASTSASETLTPDEIVRRIGLPVHERADGLFGCPVCLVGFTHRESFGPHFRVHWRDAGVPKHSIPAGTDKVTCPECNSRMTRSALNGHLATKHKIPQWEANGISRVRGFSLDKLGGAPVDVAARAQQEQWRDNKRRERSTKGSYEDRAQQFVGCPHGECGAVQKRKQIARHLEAIHHVEHFEAIEQAKHLPVSRMKRNVKSKLGYGRGTKHSVLPNVVTPNGIAPSPAHTRQGDGAPFDFTSISATDIALGVVQSQVNGAFPTALLPDVIHYVDHTREVIDKLRTTRS